MYILRFVSSDAVEMLGKHLKRIGGRTLLTLCYENEWTWCGILCEIISCNSCCEYTSDE